MSDASGRQRAACGLMFLAALTIALPASSFRAEAAAPRWHDVKCRRYASDWRQALAHFGKAGLSPSFLSSHAAFLASNCTRPADVCARSPEELKLANVMVVLSMNAGTASTFPPFACKP